MSLAPRHALPEAPAANPSPRLHVALSLLLEAHHYAQEFQRSVWDFAVEISALQPAGATNNEFRWLVCKGYVQHAAETTPAEADGRTFCPLGSLTFPDRTCFVLTESGLTFADQVCGRPPREAERQPRSTPPGTIPRWDAHRQELYWGMVLVKQFKVPAPNQELILAALEEELWPLRIDDPLPPRADQDSKRRLHDTINSLNRNQKTPVLHFMGDGKGLGIRWEVVAVGRGENELVY
jgi:hypothetical protein